MELNREDVFRKIQEKKWIELIELFKQNNVYDLLISDNIVKDVISKNFVEELITGGTFKNDSAYTYYLGQFFLLHKSAKYNFTLEENDFRRVVVKLASEYDEKGEKHLAYNYATEFPENEICENIIQKFKKTQSEIIYHSQSANITLTGSKEIGIEDFTISLFKSKQEYIFFKAVREVYQSYMVFPNVALSALIEWDKINQNLTKSEQVYFFKALVDCVVVDQENNYKPVKFIELDSVFHDTEKGKKNDLMKNNIIEKSGHTLYRVRAKNTVSDEKDFVKLIREVIL